MFEEAVKKVMALLTTNSTFSLKMAMGYICLLGLTMEKFEINTCR